MFESHYDHINRSLWRMRDVRLLRRKHSVINRHASVDLRSGVYIVFFFLLESLSNWEKGYTEYPQLNF